MEIIKTEIVELDGSLFKVDTYNNGFVVKGAYCNEECVPVPTMLPEMDAYEQAIYETHTNTEYLVALSELQ